ncbi:response regulator [Piscinibacter terrae]|nr:response regulator [Albitalea terrae]
MTAENGASVELRALVVDDNIDAATSLGYLLQLLGCKTATAFDGVSALRVAQVFQPGIVFLDLDMPGPDGCEVLAQARALEGPVARALFVCFTGRSEPADERRCLEAGFDRFLPKPMEPAVLQELLSHAHRRLAAGNQMSRRSADQGD